MIWRLLVSRTLSPQILSRVFESTDPIDSSLYPTAGLNVVATKAGVPIDLHDTSVTLTTDGTYRASFQCDTSGEIELTVAIEAADLTSTLIPGGVPYTLSPSRTIRSSFTTVSQIPPVVPAGDLEDYTVTVQLFDQYHNALETIADEGVAVATIRQVGGADVNLESTVADGAVTFAYGRGVAGVYVLTIYVLGERQLEEEFEVAPLPDWSPTESEITGSVTSTVVGETNSFNVILRDAYGNQLRHEAPAYQKCESTGNAEHQVADQRECRAEALAAGANWYSYTANPYSQCFYSDTCKTPSATIFPWSIYEADLGERIFDVSVQDTDDLDNEGRDCKTQCLGRPGRCDHCGSGVCVARPNSGMVCAAAPKLMTTTGWIAETESYQVTYEPVTSGTYGVTVKSAEFDTQMARCGAAVEVTDCTDIAGPAEKCSFYRQADLTSFRFTSLPGSSELKPSVQACTSTTQAICAQLNKEDCDADSRCVTERDAMSHSPERCSSIAVTEVGANYQLARTCLCQKRDVSAASILGSRRECKMDGDDLTGCVYDAGRDEVTFLCQAEDRDTCTGFVNADQTFAQASEKCSKDLQEQPTGCEYSGSICVANQIMYANDACAENFCPVAVGLRDAPVLEKAAFQKGGASVHFTFDEPTDMAQFRFGDRTPTEKCADIFQNAFLAKLGKEPKCTWIVNPLNGQSVALVVRLGQTQVGVDALAVGDEVRFEPDAIYRAGGAFVSEPVATVSVVTVIPPEGRPPVERIIASSSRTISSCPGATVEVDCQQTPTVSLGSARFTYRVPDDLSGAADINNALATQTGASAIVSADLFTEGIEYPMTITMVNRWGDVPTAGPAIISMKKGSIQVAVIPPGGAVDRTKEIVVKGKLILPSGDCLKAQGNTGPRIMPAMAWTSDDPFVSDILENLPLNGKGRRPRNELVLRIPASSLRPNSEFSLTLTGTPYDANRIQLPALASSAEVLISVPRSDLVAAIDKTSGEVSCPCKSLVTARNLYQRLCAPISHQHGSFVSAAPSGSASLLANTCMAVAGVQSGRFRTRW
eukprot:SAG31_NODE_1_length_62978_cov_30.836130_23_plen_1048_part_00